MLSPKSKRKLPPNDRLNLPAKYVMEMVMVMGVVMMGMANGDGGTYLTCALQGKAGSKFPVLSKPAVLSCLPRRVELSDLSPEQRERVLTLLFKKMNQMKTTAQASSLPPHSFQASNTAHKQAFDDTQVVPPPYTPGLTFLTEQRPNV